MTGEKTMEFHEKFRELRKARGLTQDDLAKELYVSRTAISKWESGKGYPSIDSLKEISKFFSVTIDELLSSEELITAAENENSRNIHGMIDLLTGMTDIMSILLILLPLYPENVNGKINAVNLFAYTHTSKLTGFAAIILIAAIIIMGAVKVIMNYAGMEKGRGAVTCLSIILSSITVLFLTMARVPYAVTVVFLLLLIKIVLLLRRK